MKTKKYDQSISRRGTITHEAIVAVIMATAAIVGTAEVLAVISYQRRDLERRSLASREAGNLMEEIAARPWTDLTEDALSELSLSAECVSVLREPRLKIAVAEEDGGVGKQISIEIDWLTSHDQRVTPQQLVAWRYPTGESEQ